MKRFPYKKLHKYPHLLAEDVVLWNRFIEQHPNRFDYCDYDVHVGDGTKLPDDYEPNYKKMAKELSQFRIDAVGWKGNLPTIIEIKPRASTTAIGQIIVYRTLFKKDFPQYPSINSMIITDWEHEEIFSIAFENDIYLVTV